jgi:TatD DNase family protein
MIDTHCHLNFKDFDKDREEVIKKSKEKLSKIINSGTNYESNYESLRLSEDYKGFIYPSFGFHPLNSGKSDYNELEIVINQIKEHMDEIIAIGEVGMDYFYIKDKKERTKQNEIFKKFAEIANEYKKPIVIHCRDAEKKAYNIVKEYDSIPKVIFHCYSGSFKTAQKLLDYNYYMSISTMICYSKHHQELIKDIPLENILTETDSPYLSPERGNRNNPFNVEEAIEKIAEIKQIDFETVNKVTEENAKKVFKL